MEIWFQDEARIGQKNGIVRQWARTGTRPRQPKDQRYGNAYIFGAICPARGMGCGLVMPFADTDAMQAHLEAIAARVTQGACAVLLFDRAGWHTTRRLNQPFGSLPAQHIELMAQGDDFGLAVNARPEEPYNRTPDQLENARHREQASPNICSLASQIRFTVGTGGLIWLWAASSDGTEQMLKRKRQRIDASLKTVIALEALQERSTVTDLAQRHGVHPNQIYAWKKQLQEQAVQAFGPRIGQDEIQWLHAKIGQLTLRWIF